MINRVRLAFQVTFVLELVERISLQVVSRFYTFEFTQGEKDLTWPASEPSRADFKIWIKFISCIINTRSTLSHTLTP